MSNLIGSPVWRMLDALIEEEARGLSFAVSALNRHTSGPFDSLPIAISYDPPGAFDSVQAPDIWTKCTPELLVKIAMDVARHTDRIGELKRFKLRLVDDVDFRGGAELRAKIGLAALDGDTPDV